MKAIFALLLAMAAGVTLPSAASALELNCKMTDYGTAGRTSGLDSFVPRTAIHQISDTSSRIKGRKGKGTVEDLGSKLRIRYFGTLKDVGEAEVTYTYSRSTGRMTAVTRGLKSVQWEAEHPERAGKYIITGSCTAR